MRSIYYIFYVSKWIQVDTRVLEISAFRYDEWPNLRRYCESWWKGVQRSTHLTSGHSLTTVWRQYKPPDNWRGDPHTKTGQGKKPLLALGGYFKRVALYFSSFCPLLSFPFHLFFLDHFFHLLTIIGWSPCHINISFCYFDTLKGHPRRRPGDGDGDGQSRQIDLTSPNMTDWPIDKAKNTTL